MIFWLQPDKWSKLCVSDDARMYLYNFLDRCILVMLVVVVCNRDIGDNDDNNTMLKLLPRDMHQELVISQNIGGQLQVLRKNRSFTEVSFTFRFTRTGQARWGTREFTLSSGTRFLSVVLLVSSCICPVLVFVKKDKVIPDLTWPRWSGWRHFQEPIPHLDEGLSNKEMNEQLLNYLTCGDVHPNVLGWYLAIWYC